MSSNILKADNGVSSGTTGLVYTAGNDGTLQLATTTSGGTATTAVTIDNSQNVGVGVTPVGSDSRFKNIEIGASTSVSDIVVSSTSLLTYLQHNSYVSGGATYFKYTGGSNYASQYSQTNGQHIWQISTAAGTGGSACTFTQAMTLNNSGQLLLGLTSTSGSNLGIFSSSLNGSFIFQAINNDSTNPRGIYFYAPNSNATDYAYLYDGTGGTHKFYVSGSGQIYSTSTSITAISDQTLKTNVKPLDTGLAEIIKLQPRRFDWKAESGITGTNVVGFVSQEVQSVLPDLVDSYVFSENEDGTNKIEKLGLKMGDMIPTMVKAIQELSAQVTALEAKVA